MRRIITLVAAALAMAGCSMPTAPADDASAQRWRSTWTCDHYSGPSGHFLDGS